VTAADHLLRYFIPVSHMTVTIVAGQPIGHGRGLFGGNPFNPTGKVRLPERYDKSRTDPVDLMSA